MHRTNAAALAALLWAASAACGAGEILRWKDAQGVVHYSDHAEQGAQAESVQLRPDPAPAAPPPTPAAGKSAQAKPSRPQPEPVDVSILMYVMPRCGYCERARNHFRSRGVAWQEVDITASAAAERDFHARGGRGTPLTYINGVRVAGFDPEGYDRALARFGYP